MGWPRREARGGAHWQSPSPPLPVPPIACNHVQGSGFRVQGSEFRVQGSGFRVQGSGFRVQGSGFGVQGSGSGFTFGLRFCPNGAPRNGR